MDTPGVFRKVVIDMNIIPSSKDESRSFDNICSLWMHVTGTMAVDVGFNTFNPGDSFQFLCDRNTMNQDITLDIKFNEDKVVPGCTPVKELQFITKTLTICKCSNCMPDTIRMEASEIRKCPICS